MPIVANTQVAAVRAANTVMSRAFFPRAKKWIYPRICGSYTSTALVEPHAILGAAPPLRKFLGRMTAKGVPSWRADVPNPLFKNILKVDQTDYEGDQTKTLISLSQQIGVRLSEFPDTAFCYRILRGSTANSQYESFQGQQYTLTFDGQPYFSASHDVGNGAVQSNIIQGELPATKDLILDDDYATNAIRMQRDVQRLISAIKTVKDNQGQPLFPTLEMKESVVVMVPPILEPIAALAFRSEKSVINQTTNVAPLFVKDVISTGYLEGLSNPYSEEGEIVTPVNETDYYVFIDNDFIKPMYVQLFRPPKDNELFPPDYDVDAEIDRILKANSEITVDQAVLYASTRVDTTFNKIGENADAYTIENENFLMSGRYRGNSTYGPWFLAWRVKPQGGN